MTTLKRGMVIDVDLNKITDFHKSHGKIGTVTGVTPQSRYGELVIEDDRVLAFEEKPANKASSISGGYFIFNKEIFDYLSDEPACVLEKEPLHNLAQDGQLKVYVHDGFWQCMDTYRDYVYFQDELKKGKAPWKKW